jgi:hypothetical protein
MCIMCNGVPAGWMEMFNSNAFETTVFLLLLCGLDVVPCVLRCSCRLSMMFLTGNVEIGFRPVNRVSPRGKGLSPGLCSYHGGKEELIMGGSIGVYHFQENGYGWVIRVSDGKVTIKDEGDLFEND